MKRAQLVTKTFIAPVGILIFLIKRVMSEESYFSPGKYHNFPFMCVIYRLDYCVVKKKKKLY